MNVSGEAFVERLDNNTNRMTTWSPNNSSENATYNSNDGYTEYLAKIKPITDILLVLSFITIMLAMGFEIRKEELLYHIKRPISISIGMFSQFVALPLSAFVLLQCTSVSGIYATGVLLISCCPGGMVSNIFAHLCDGDLSLSVAMTSLSTLMAAFMMPLNLWMYGRVFETKGLVVPYAKLATTLVCITSPVAAGMFLRWKFPRIAPVASKGGVIISMLLLAVFVVCDMLTFPNMFSNIPVKMYPIVICLPVIGFSMGYVLAMLFHQSPAVRKTIALECGVQNAPSALAIISLSFPEELKNEITFLPYIYSLAMISCGLVFCSLYQVYKKCLYQKIATEESATKEELIEKEAKNSELGSVKRCRRRRPSATNEDSVIEICCAPTFLQQHISVPSIDEEVFEIQQKLKFAQS